MGKLLSLGAASLFLGLIVILGLAPSGGRDRGVNNTVRERLVGASTTHTERNTRAARILNP